MRLRIMCPTSVIFDGEVNQVNAEDAEGHFTLKERHIDLATLLLPGLLRFIDSQGGEQFVAVDEGVLIKEGRNVLVSTRHAAVGAPLGELRELVEKQQRALVEQERNARVERSVLEVGFIKRFIDQSRL